MEKPLELEVTLTDALYMDYAKFLQKTRFRIVGYIMLALGLCFAALGVVSWLKNHDADLLFVILTPALVLGLGSRFMYRTYFSKLKRSAVYNTADTIGYTFDTDKLICHVGSHANESPYDEMTSVVETAGCFYLTNRRNNTFVISKVSLGARADEFAAFARDRFAETYRRI